MFSYYRMCSLTTECVLLLPAGVQRVVGKTIECVLNVYDDVTYVYDDVTYVYDDVTGSR